MIFLIALHKMNGEAINWWKRSKTIQNSKPETAQVERSLPARTEFINLHSSGSKTRKIKKWHFELTKSQLQATQISKGILI